MKRKQRKKFQLNRETILHLNFVRGASPPSEFGSNCEACITQTIPDTGVACMTAACPSGNFTECDTCAFC